VAQVEFRGLGKTFADGTLALQELDVTVADGELLVIVGPSGCGKSTILRLLAGFESASRGDILIDGRSVLAQPPQERDIAMVFQNYALYPHMSVRDNLAFPLRMAKRPRAVIDKQVHAVAEVLDLTDLLRKKPSELSGGQSQRVAMGRALVREPKVFLLDEPLSNLDPQLRGQVRGEIAALQRRLNSTMVYVTHDQVEAMTLGHRVAVLNKGELQQIGAPQTLYDQPCNRFVAGFLGSPPMNLCEAQLYRDRGEVAVRLGDDSLALPARLRQALRGYRGNTVLLGMRPEALTLGSGDGGNTISVTSLAEERLGHERLLHAAAPSTTVDYNGVPQNPGILSIRLPSGPAMQAGTTVSLRVDAERLYCFTPIGKAIGRLADEPPNGFETDL